MTTDLETNITALKLTYATIHEALDGLGDLRMMFYEFMVQHNVVFDVATIIKLRASGQSGPITAIGSNGYVILPDDKIFELLADFYSTYEKRNSTEEVE